MQKPSLHNTLFPLTAPNIHDIAQDPRNASILISVNGILFPREKAMVSVFDSGFILVDSVLVADRRTASTHFDHIPLAPNPTMCYLTQ